MARSFVATGGGYRCRQEELNFPPLPHQDSPSHFFPFRSRSMRLFSSLQRAFGLKLCTCTDTSRFPLHRRDGGAQVIGVVAVDRLQHVEAQAKETGRRPVVGAKLHSLRHGCVSRVPPPTTLPRRAPRRRGERSETWRRLHPIRRSCASCTRAKSSVQVPGHRQRRHRGD